MAREVRDKPEECLCKAGVQTELVCSTAGGGVGGDDVGLGPVVELLVVVLRLRLRFRPCPPLLLALLWGSREYEGAMRGCRGGESRTAVDTTGLRACEASEAE
jgi:hypothetical protein